MSKLVFKILALIALVLVMNHLFYRFIIQPNASYSWGYDILDAKRKHLVENNDQYNTLFIGSSAMFRHINPNVFDAVCDDSLDIKSFNFGIQAMFPLQSAYTYDNLLKQDNLEIKYAFMDLFEVGNMALSVNAVKKRTHYWYRLSDYREGLKISSQYDSSPLIKINAYFGYTIAYLAKLFNAEIIEEILLKEKHKSSDNFPFLLNNKHGFYPLDQELIDKKGKSKEMEMRRNGFLSDTTAVTARIIDRRDFFRNYEEGSLKANKLHLQKINDLIELSEKHGIHLIFVLHPRLFGYEYSLLMPIYEALPEANKLNLNDTEKYSQFYRAKYTFDALHLNEEGANLYSKALGEAFNELMKKN